MNDVALLFTTRGVRLFAYGFLSVVLVLYLQHAGLRDRQIGILLSLTLFGDVLLSLYLTTRADAFGRRRTLIVGAILMIAAGAAFAASHSFVILLIAATVGVISPSGNEVGPFLAIEQAALADVIADREHTALFAWYQLGGSFATALGALACGAFLLRATYRDAILVYGFLGFVLIAFFLRLSRAIEHERFGEAGRGLLRIERSRRVVLQLSALFAVDSFAGALVVQSVLAWWFHIRFGLNSARLGAIFFGANLLAGISALGAAAIARRIGLLNTMVFTHLPSNILLLLVPFMPTAELAIAMLLLRFSISQMDVPTRQAYLMKVVDPGERTAAAGITNSARAIGAACAPVIAVPLMASRYDWLPFVAAGALKVIYDLVLLWRFRQTESPSSTAP